MVVTDTGCGMSEQMLAQVFQPFEQEDGSTARKYGGSGLGLSIVKYLVELMGGSISVNSAKGKGSTFTVQLTLPYAEELAEKDGTTAEQNLHGLHLLLAEDNPLNQELCLELLKSRGISSDCAVNGKEATGTVYKQRPRHLCSDPDGYSDAGPGRLSDNAGDPQQYAPAGTDDPDHLAFGRCFYRRYQARLRQRHERPCQ